MQSAFSIFIILTDGKIDDIGLANEQVWELTQLLFLLIHAKCMIYTANRIKSATEQEKILEKIILLRN